jgi:hypothetical protein
LLNDVDHRYEHAESLLGMPVRCSAIHLCLGDSMAQKIIRATFNLAMSSNEWVRIQNFYAGECRL